MYLNWSSVGICMAFHQLDSFPSFNCRYDLLKVAFPPNRLNIDSSSMSVILEIYQWRANLIWQEVKWKELAVTMIDFKILLEWKDQELCLSSMSSLFIHSQIWVPFERLLYMFICTMSTIFVPKDLITCTCMFFLWDMPLYWNITYSIISMSLNLQLYWISGT